jgi:N-acetylmuramoyl-L-alanine amidase
VSGSSGAYLRLRTGRHGEAWVQAKAAEDLPSGTPPPSGWLSGVGARPAEDGRRERVILDLGRVGPHWFRHDPLARNAALDLPGARMNPYQIHRSPACGLVRTLDLTVLGEGEGARLNIGLAEPLWGWRTRVEGGKLILELKRPPAPAARPFEGLHIMIDPGHGGEGKPWCYGASNPFGYPEKHANLAVGLALRDLLSGAGARVTLTREDDRDIRAEKGFEAVTAMIRQADPDLYLAIHHNGVGESTDPRTRHGRETFWLFPHQRALAEALAAVSGPVTEEAPSEVFGRTYFFTNMTDPQAALVEVGYMGHPIEGPDCQDPARQAGHAREIFVALERHLRELRRVPSP